MKNYIDSEQHWEDSVNADYDHKKAMKQEDNREQPDNREQGQGLPIDSVSNCFKCGEHIKPELFIKGEKNECGECHYK